MADQDRGGHRSAALFGQQLGAVRGDELRQLALQLIDLAVQSAQLRDLLAGDPDTRAGEERAQPAVDRGPMAASGFRGSHGGESPCGTGFAPKLFPSAPTALIVYMVFGTQTASVKGVVMKRGFSIALVLVGVLGAASAAWATGSGWSIQTTPNPTGATSSALGRVSCPSQSACTAVGASYNGTTLATLAEAWNGTTWTLQTTPNPTGVTFLQLTGVSCTSANACTAVGFYSTNGGSTYVTLAERWNGTTWSIQTTPNPTGATYSELQSVSCTSASVCTAVGYWDNGVLAERWNGTNWSIRKTPDVNPTDGLFGVSCSSGKACTAVGSYEKGSTAVTLAERWNGTTWSIQKPPNPSGAKVTQLNDISCSSGKACTAVGVYVKGSTGKTLAEYWNGTKWSIQTSLNRSGVTETELGDVSCSSKSACTAVGESNTRTAVKSLVERWNGTKWSIQRTPNGGLAGVSCASKSVCTAVGDYKKPSVTLAERWNGG